jgi:hypothetical protein
MLAKVSTEKCIGAELPIGLRAKADDYFPLEPILQAITHKKRERLEIDSRRVGTCIAR